MVTLSSHVKATSKFVCTCPLLLINSIIVNYKHNISVNNYLMTLSQLEIYGLHLQFF